MGSDGKKVIGMGEAIKQGLMIEPDPKNYEGLVVSKNVMAKLDESEAFAGDDYGDIEVDRLDRVSMFLGEVMPTMLMRRKTLHMGVPVRVRTAILGNVWIIVNDLPGATIVLENEMGATDEAREMMREIADDIDSGEIGDGDFDYDFDDDFDDSEDL